MMQFVGTHRSRLDSKNRVSVPAEFRNVLKNGDGTVRMILRPSHNHACIEGWPPAMFEALSAPLQKFDVFSPEQDDLAAVLFATAHAVEADKEGRIVLPDTLKEHAGLTDTVDFRGLGRTFQMWEPKAGEAWHAAAVQRVRARGLTLPGGSL